VLLRPLPAEAAPPVATGLPRVASGRRNLVVLRAGPGSLHPAWLWELPDAERSWDLCLSWYGDPAEDPGPCEYFIPARGTKFEGLATLLAGHAFAFDYDFIWFPDDDLLAEGQDINLMFALCRDHDLLLAQPSLAAGSHVNHPITERDTQFQLRFSSFVEIMAPVFAVEALRICAFSFGLTRSGYGLDHLWPRLLGGPVHRIAILDAMAVVHTRPVGSSYAQGPAIAEGLALGQRFGLLRRYPVHGTIFRHPEGQVVLRDYCTGQPSFLTAAAAEAAYA
jgi:hypothetical protein